MAEFNDTYRKAGILMTSALKKYGEGDYEGGNRDRQEANRMYDLAEKEVNSAQETVILYGENRNFGTIYKVFESNTPNLFNSKKENSKIKKILKLIKENKVLKSEFDLYKALVYPESVTNAEEYVNEALSIIPNFDKKQVIENNQKFIDLIREMKLNEMIELSDEDSELFEAIEYLMFNKKTLDNINDYVDAKTRITEHIEKNCMYQNVNNENVDNVYDNGLKQISEKYDSVLNSDEKMLVEKLTHIQNKEAYFDIAKLNALKMLNLQLKECDENNKDNLNRIIENINKKKYDTNSFISDAAEFREIKNMLVQEGTMTNDIVKTLSIELAKSYRGEESRNRDWIMGELSYNTPDNVDSSKIVDDIKKLSSRYNPEDVGYMVISNMMSGQYCGWWNENKNHSDMNEGFTPSDSFDGYAIDDNGGMLPINNMKMIVTFAATHPEYFEQLPSEIKKSVEDCKKYFEEHPDIDWELQK